MKKSLLLKRISVLFFALIPIWQIGHGQALLVENFDYTAGSLLTANGWTAHNGGGSQAIDVITPGLSFTGYPSGGIGGAAQVDNTGEDVNKTFLSQSSGAVYAAALVKVNTIADGYFFHLGQTSIGTSFFGRVFIKTSGSNFLFGLSKGSEAAVYGSTEYTLGSTYLIVLKYNIVSGTTNDEVSLYVFDTTIPTTEPVTATIPAFTVTNTDYNPGAIALRQYNSSQNITVDGIRIATNWTDAISDIYPPAPTFIPANSATDVAISVTPTITFDEPVRKTDGNALENSDLATLITLKKTNSSGDNVAFSATIDAAKKLITVTPSSALDNSQIYYLAVGAVEDGSGNETTGSNITFTTISASTPTVTITYPVGGESFYAGDNLNITWTSANIANVKIEIWVVGSTRTWKWETTAESTPAAAGTFALVVPSDATYGTEYKVKITDAGSSVYSESGNFTCIPVATSLTDLKARCILNDIVKLSSEATVTFLRSAANRNQKYIQDAGAGMVIDDASAVLTTVLAVGDNIKNFEGKLGTYHGMWQMVPTNSAVTVASTGNTVTPILVTIPDYTADFAKYEARIIKIQNVNFTGADGSVTFGAETKYPLSDGTNTVQFFTFEADESNIVGSVIPLGNYAISGLALKYDTYIEIAGRTTSDFEFLTVGMDELSSTGKISIYPVPASSVLNIRSVPNLKSIEILDITGRIIRTINTGTDELIQVPVTSLRQGMYLIRFNTADGKVVKRFVKS